MKGLLLKDLYMMRKYCRTYLLVTLVFFAVGFSGNENPFFMIYPCLFCGMIPVTLLAYDERSGFLRYSAVLPCTRGEFVSEKYLLGLLVQLALLLLTAIVQAARLRLGVGDTAASDFPSLMTAVLLVSCVASSIPLPFMFRYGTEKGRIAYYVMIGLVCAASVIFSAKMKLGTPSAASGIITALLVLGGVCVYVLSWRLSIRFFKKREL